MNGPHEANADVRQISGFHYSMYVGYKAAGFSAQEALFLVGQWIVGATGGGKSS